MEMRLVNTVLTEADKHEAKLSLSGIVLRSKRNDETIDDVERNLEIALDDVRENEETIGHAGTSMLVAYISYQKVLLPLYWSAV